MRPELQVAVRCDLGRLSLASAAREVPPDPAPRSCPARPEPLRERPLLAPQTTTLSLGPPKSYGSGGGSGRGASSQAARQAVTELLLGPPRTRVSPARPQPSTSTPRPPPPPATPTPASGSRNSTLSGRQAAHAPWGWGVSDASGGRDLEHPLASSLRLQLNPECASGGSHVTGCHCGGGSRGRRGRGGAEITPPGRHDKSHLQSSNT